MIVQRHVQTTTRCLCDAAVREAVMAFATSCVSVRETWGMEGRLAVDRMFLMP